jgi:hypothetical protein
MSNVPSCSEVIRAAENEEKMDETLGVRLGPIGITGSGVVGVGAAVVIVILVLAWFTLVDPPFVF